MQTEETADYLAALQADRTVQKMKNHIQHGRVTTFDHCAGVANACAAIDRRLSLHCDRRVLLSGAMLHDFFLYDWHEKDGGAHRLHGFRHAETACRNAKKYFDIDDRICHVIYCHMWPLNPGRIPRSREAWVVCLADKWISLQETLFKR